MQRPHWIRFATFLVWLLAAGSVVYWVLKFVGGPTAPLSATVATPAAGAGAVDLAALARGLGGGQTLVTGGPTLVAVPSAFQANRFVLTGVVVQKTGANQGVALIAVDGKPSRPYRVGVALADGIVLHSVSNGKAMLATALDAPVGLTLELPRLTTALVGTAVAARPVMPAAISAAPIPLSAPTPMALAATMATTAANPTAALGTLGTRPPRPLANRQREAEKEGRDQNGAPAQ